MGRRRVVLVGRQQVSAWRLADGQPAWTTKLPTEALPTGRGYVSENTYHLPLSDGSLTPLEIAAVLYLLARGKNFAAPWHLDYWAFGNELWGCGGNMRPEYYADLYRHYITFMKAPEGAKPLRIAGLGEAERKSALKERAMADEGVQAMLDVFSAEIRDVEEM